MEVNSDLVSPCGLYCGVCAILIAPRDANQNICPECGNKVFRGANKYNRCKVALDLD